MPLVSSFVFLFFLLLFLRRGVLDYIVLSFLSASLFFVPAFIGYVAGPPGYPDLVLSYHVYLTYWLLCVCLFFSAIIHDAFVKDAGFSVAVKQFAHSAHDNVKHGILFFIFFIALFDFSLLSFSTKREMMDEAGVRIQLAMPCLVLSAVFFSLDRHLKYKVFGFFLALFSIYVGFRSYFVCYLIVMSTLIYNLKFESMRVKTSWKFAIFMVPMLFFVILSKRIYGGLKLGSGVHELFGDGVWSAFTKGSEFFSTQYIYQSIINNSYTLEVKHYMLSFLAFLPVPQSFWGVGSSYFNTAFQSDLFADIDYGMAYNPWAEAYAYMGFPGVVLLVLSYCYVLTLLQWVFIRSRFTYLPILLSIVLFYLSFYFHRNSLAVEFSFFRNYMYTFFLGMFLVNVFSALGKRRFR